MFDCHKGYVARMCSGLTLTVIVPSILSISPSRAESSEDFPEPTSPTTATREPSGMCTFKLERKSTTILLYCILFELQKCENTDFFRVGTSFLDQLSTPSVMMILCGAGEKKQHITQKHLTIPPGRF